MTDEGTIAQVPANPVQGCTTKLLGLEPLRFDAGPELAAPLGKKLARAKEHEGQVGGTAAGEVCWPPVLVTHGVWWGKSRAPCLGCLSLALITTVS